MKRDARQKGCLFYSWQLRKIHHFWWASLFIFGPSYFVKALPVVFGLLKWCQLLGHLQHPLFFSREQNLFGFQPNWPISDTLNPFRQAWTSLDQFEVLPKLGHFQLHFSFLAQNLFDFVTLSWQKCMKFVNLSWKIHNHITWGRCYQ